MSPIGIASTLLLVWSLFAFGGVYPWAGYPIAVGCVTVGLLTAIGRASATSTSAIRELGPWLLFVLLAALVQLVPVPLEILATISPGAAFIVNPNAALHPDQAWPRLSLVPSETFSSIVWCALLALLFIGATRITRALEVRRVMTIIVVLGVLLALLGLAQGSNERIYGVWMPEGVSQPMGPFVNRNHFAGWMVLALALNIGMFCRLLEEQARRVGTGWRARVIALTGAEGSQMVMVTFGMLVMAIALVASLSRSGLLSCIALLLCATAFVVRRGRLQDVRSLRVGHVAVVAAMGWAFVWLGTSPVAARFASADTSMGSRMEVWRDAARTAADFPIVGTGLGGYGLLAPRYQAESGARGAYLEAHNDYLQLLVEGGLLLCVPALLLLTRGVRTFRRLLDTTSGSDEYWARASAASGIVAVAVQETVEFSLRSPAVAVLFVIACGLALHDRPVEQASS